MHLIKNKYKVDTIFYATFKLPAEMHPCHPRQCPPLQKTVPMNTVGSIAMS